MLNILSSGLSPGVARLITCGVMVFSDEYLNATERVRELYDFPDNWVMTKEDAETIRDRFVRVMPYLSGDTVCALQNYLILHQPVYRAWCEEYT